MVCVEQGGRESFARGRVYPQSCSQADGEILSMMQTECVLQVHHQTATVDVRVRFLQRCSREYVAAAFERAELQEKALDRQDAGQWLMPGLRDRLRQDVTEREIRISSVWLPTGRRCCLRRSFVFPGARNVELVSDGNGDVAGAIVRRQESLIGTVEVQSHSVGFDCLKIGVRVINETSFPGVIAEDMDGVLMRSFESPHTILHAEGGAFLSPGDAGNHRDVVESCENIGTWPVLVGKQGAGMRDTLLSSPIILPDDPRIAAERSGCGGRRSEAPFRGESTGVSEG